jgi:hypothetical protein
MRIKMSILICIAVLTLGITFAFAAETQTIAGIPKDATAAEFIAYFFNLAVAVGAFIAVVIIVMAGIEWMTAGGNPGKIESAKDKIKNTLLGVAILMGCYIILGIINPNLTTIKINELSCEQGIVVKTKLSQDSTEKAKQVCIADTTSSINYYIESTLNWNFPADTLLAVYTYTEDNFTGDGKEFSCEEGGCSGKFREISGSKSIYFVWKNPGFYLYDQTDYKLGTKPYPLFVSSNSKKLGNFDNLTSSIKKVNPNPEKEKNDYIAVVFADPNYKGACSFLADNVKNMSSPVGRYSTPINNGQLSSIIVTKSSYDQSVSSYRGTVTLYNTVECSPGSSSEIKSCPVSWFGEGNVSDYCEKSFGFNSGDAVMSFSITGYLGLVLRTTEIGVSGGNCRYFDLSIIKDNCYSINSEPDIYNPPSGVKPKSFIVFPVDINK